MYDFTYDGVNRLKETSHKKKSGGSWVTNANHYLEKGITYDRNGNILTLQRTGNGNLVDNLLYTYAGNQLSGLQETVRTSLPEDIYLPGSAPNGTYEYDSNGNQLKDTRKGLEFGYNCLDLLSEVKRNNHIVSSYLYSADGTKLGVRNGDGSSGYDYVGSLIYKRESGIPVLESALFADGQLKSTGVNYTLTDHLGSVRAIVDANGEVQEQNDYYPFGSRHMNTGYASNGNHYLFSGKERQDLSDLNRYDFGARMYDSDIARWATVDPLAEDYYSQSLFGYCGNNPVSFVDAFGLDYWSTSDPALIGQFLSTIQRGHDNVYGMSSMSFDLSGWEHLSDNEFTAGLSYNDATGMFHWSTAGIVNGEWEIVGHSLSNRLYGLPAIRDNQLNFAYYNALKAENASGRLNNVYPESYLFSGLTKSGAALYKNLIKSLFRSMSTVNTVNANQSGIVSNNNREKTGKSIKNMSGNRAVQDKQVDSLVKKYKLNKAQRKELHRLIHHEGYGYRELEQVIKEYFNK